MSSDYPEYLLRAECGEGERSCFPNNNSGVTTKKVFYFTPTTLDLVTSWWIVGYRVTLFYF